MVEISQTLLRLFFDLVGQPNGRFLQGSYVILKNLGRLLVGTLFVLPVCCSVQTVGATARTNAKGGTSLCDVSEVVDPPLKINLQRLMADCRTKIESTAIDSPAVFEDENFIEINNLSFDQVVGQSGRFASDEKQPYIYDYSLDSEESQHTIRTVEPPSVQQMEVGGRRLLIGHVAVRVNASPYKLWPPGTRKAALKKYGVEKAGLIFDCSYGVATTAHRSVVISACIPREINNPRKSRQAVQRLLSSI